MSAFDDVWQTSMDPAYQASRDTGPRSANQPFVEQRLQSLDAYRGLIMITLAFAGFGLARTATNQAQHLEGLKAQAQSDAHVTQVDQALQAWSAIKFHTTHVQWVGCSYWDLIQPSFMFMVGASMAFSYAKRRDMGHSFSRMLLHAIWRSLLLIFLGISLISNWGSSTNWSLMNVLTQIGLGYTFLFLLWGRSFRTQSEVALLLLAGVWCAYYFYPRAGIDLETGVPIHAVAAETQVGITPDWAQQNLAGVARAWHKNANVGQYLDKHWILPNLPRNEPYEYNSGGYQTINFIPSLVTMLLGLMSGELLKSGRPASYKLLMLLLSGAVGLGLGYALNQSGICPLIKRLWTPSWVLYSTGWCCLILAGLYAIIDAAGIRFWAFPLRVVGLNSIAIYCMSQLLKPWVGDTLERHFGDQVFKLKLKFGEEYYRLSNLDESQDQMIALFEPTIQAVMVGLVFWLVCFWMYRQKFFVRI